MSSRCAARSIVVRLDANSKIGSGHAMRCLSVVAEMEALGAEVVFAVSDDESAEFVEARGGMVHVLGGAWSELGDEDAIALARFCHERDAVALLVDTYAATLQFFEQLRERLDEAIRVAYIDDLYAFDTGRQNYPLKLDVDAVVNYGFGASREVYRAVYESSVDLLIGPSFAPVRPSFKVIARNRTGAFQRVLVTAGSTNPYQALERMVEGVLAVLPDACIDVVQGPLADFDLPGLSIDQVHIRKGVRDLAPLMQRADLAVSAAGSTLYELACAGVPTLACPSVENQIPNAVGYGCSGAGRALTTLSWGSKDVADRLSALLAEPDFAHMPHMGRKLVDGQGASRIANYLLGCAPIGRKVD